MVGPGGVGDDLQDRDEVGHLGHGQQTGQPEHLVGHTGVIQGVHERGELAALAAEDGPGGGHALLGQVGLTGGLEGLDHGLGLGHGVRVPGEPDLPVHGEGRGAQGLELDPLLTGLAQGGCHGVGGVEHVHGVTPGHGEVPDGGGSAFAVWGEAGELGGHGEQLAGGGPAEAVDGLVGVTYGGDGVTVAVETSEEHHLGVGGVLELVQQHHLESGAFSGPDGGDPLGDVRGVADEIAVVHDAGLGLGLLERGDEIGHGGPGAQRGDQGVDLLAGALHLLLHVWQGQPVLHDPIQVCTDLFGGDEVLGAVAGQAHDPGDQGGEGAGEEGQIALVGAGQARGELVGLGLAHQLGVRFDADAHAVVTDQGVGIGVVGGDAGSAGPVLQEQLVRVGVLVLGVWLCV